MDSTEPAQAAHDEAAARDTDEWIITTPTLPLEIITLALELTLDYSRPQNCGDFPARNEWELSTYSLVSKDVGQWAQKQLFKNLYLEDDVDAINVVRTLPKRRELGASVRRLELGPGAWWFFRRSPRHMKIMCHCIPAYKRGELTMMLSWTEFDFSSLHRLAYYIGGLILDQSTFYEIERGILDEPSGSSGDDDDEKPEAPPSYVFLFLRTLEIKNAFQLIRRRQQLEPKAFPALRTLIFHPPFHYESGYGGSSDALFAVRRILPQLTSLFFTRPDDRFLDTLAKSTNLRLLDVPLGAFAASRHTHWGPPIRTLPRTLRAIRLRLGCPHASQVPIGDFLDANAELALKSVLDLMKAEVMKGSATLEKLVLPEEVKEGTVPSWLELVNVAQRQGVVAEYEECDAEDDVAIFEALRREMKLVEVAGWPAVRS